MSKNTGKAFEDLVKTSAKEQGFDFNRLKDAGYTGFGDNGGNKRFTSRNICDCTIFGNGHLFYLECKHSKEKRFDFSRATQQKDLMKKHKEGAPNVHTGYLLCLAGEFFYLSAFDLQLLMDAGEKKSANTHELLIAGHHISKTKTSRQKVYRVDLNTLPFTAYA